jgi:CheY-like chemotaxis protein
MLDKFHSVESDRAADGFIAVSMIKERLEKKCCNKMYSLIFMDIQMPGLDGF